MPTPAHPQSELENSGPPRGRRHYLVACLLFFSLAIVYVALIVYLDNTNLATTNGLWKAPMVLAWERGTGRAIDTGDLLYIPAYGVLSRFVPVRAVSYGVRNEVVTLRKMAMLNGLFSALASCGVFLLALGFSESLISALVVTFAHASTGFVLLHAVNSEDVAPAYAFFVLTVMFFFEYVRTRKPRWLVLCTAFLALTTAFHWTLMAPALAALLAAQFVLVAKRKHTAWLPVAFTLLFLGMIGMVTLLVQVLYPDLSYSFLQVLYPPKAHPDGYAGFTWNKLVYVLIGIGNYFSGARSIGDYKSLPDPNVLRPMLFSWSYCALVVGACALALVSRGFSRRLRLLAGFCLIVFGIGEMEAFYVLPHDPQWQMEPMFAAIAGLIITFSFLRFRLSRSAFRIVAVVLALAFLANGFWTVKLLSATRGADSRFVMAVKELVRLFPPEKVTRVSHVYEPWNAWWCLEVHRGDWNGYVAENILLFTIFTEHRGISAAGAADIVKRRITDAFAAGRRVVACSLWTQERADFVGLMSAVIDNAKAEAYYDALRNAFRLGQTWDTPVGRFVELLPAGSGAN